jgi:hypothetical protein
MTSVEKTGRRGLTVFACDPSSTIRTRHYSGLADVLALGSQTVLPPTLHPAGVLYRWTTTATLLDLPIAALPVIAADLADKLASALAPWRNAPEPALVWRQLQRCELSENERVRQRRYVEMILARELPVLASIIPNSGRNQAAFRIVCRVGRWVHHGIIARDQLITDVFEACERNGLVHDDGRKAVLDTIASGLAKSASDTLPELALSKWRAAS